MTGSALYFGTVRHSRLRPKRHALSYGVFYVLLDLDEIGALAEHSRLFSYNRFGLFSFHDRDHGDGASRALRPYVEGQLARAGIDLAGGAVRVLCFPRVLGYVFNPISIYFCHHADGSLRAILYEVSNTFGERHSYLLPVTGGGEVVVQSCRKEFYVSPFLGMDCAYEFRVSPPGEKLSVLIRQSDGEGAILYANLVGRRAAFTDRMLALAFLRYPLITLKVIACIHWEALKLWRKGLRVLPHPAPPADAVSLPQADH